MYAIFTVDGLDQIVETKAQARKEAREVAAIAGKAWAYRLSAGFDVEVWADRNPGKRPTRAAGATLEITAGADW